VNLQVEFPSLILIHRGANLGFLGDDDWTILHKACFQGHEDVATLLIDRGLDVNAKDINGIKLQIFIPFRVFSKLQDGLRCIMQ
jgi:ankyrin repeat protein